jgi:hypothetical protein
MSIVNSARQQRLKSRRCDATQAKQRLQRKGNPAMHGVRKDY